MCFSQVYDWPIGQDGDRKALWRWRMGRPLKPLLSMGALFRLAYRRSGAPPPPHPTPPPLLLLLLLILLFLPPPVVGVGLVF
jgi:hypothetical protein